MSPRNGPNHLSGGLAETIPIWKSLAKRTPRLYKFSICFFSRLLLALWRVCAERAHYPKIARKRFRRKAFDRTNTLERLMAAAANTGDKSWPVNGYSAPAATGISATL